MTDKTATEQPKAKIASKVFIRGQIIAQTGLHIGGNSVSMAIGNTDNVVVRNPLTSQPYIPGSSLRGRMRSLMERCRGDEQLNPEEGGFHFDSKKGEAKPGEKPNSKIGKLFGVAADQGGTPSRLMVRDAALTKKSLEELSKAPNLDMPMTEVKTEVVIDRITAAANPRQMERVPAGAEFQFEMILTLLEEDKLEEYLDLVCEGLRLVEDDALGGSGSRGYGKVKFVIGNQSVTQKTVDDYKNGEKGSPVSDHKILTEFTPPPEA